MKIIASIASSWQIAAMRAFPKKSFWTVLLLLALLVAVRAYLPTAVTRYVNRTIDRIPDYDGEIYDVDLHLWRGAYTIHRIRIEKTTGEVPVPFFSSDAIDLSIEWSALLEGKVVGEVYIEQGQFNFVAGPSNATSQTELDDEWLKAIKDLFPLRINRFHYRNGEIHYRDFHSSPQVDLKLQEVNLVGRDLNNTRTPTKGLTANIEGTARRRGGHP